MFLLPLRLANTHTLYDILLLISMAKVVEVRYIAWFIFARYSSAAAPKS